MLGGLSYWMLEYTLVEEIPLKTHDLNSPRRTAIWRKFGLKSSMAFSPLPPASPDMSGPAHIRRNLATSRDAQTLEPFEPVVWKLKQPPLVTLQTIFVRPSYGQTLDELKFPPCFFSQSTSIHCIFFYKEIWGFYGYHFPRLRCFLSIVCKLVLDSHGTKSF